MGREFLNIADVFDTADSERVIFLINSAGN